MRGLIDKEGKIMKKITIGFVAPVDAGKTTLAESLLYQAGVVRQLGRVDHQDAFLDPEALEKQRGITIAAHQAHLQAGDTQVTILDTPGHIDFAAATEEVLQVLDYAVLLVSAADGVVGSTRFLWELLAKAGVPTMIFVNKMDAPGADRQQIMRQLTSQLDSACVDFTGAASQMTAAVADNAAAVDEQILAQYLETGQLADKDCRRMIAKRQLFPVFFGTALQQDGTDALLDALDHWTEAPALGQQWAARCFKISHAATGERLSWLKVTGGQLQAKTELLPGQKVDHLRVYNGAKFKTVRLVAAGDVCAATGLTDSFAGQGFGQASDFKQAQVHPVLSYAVDPGDEDIEKVQQALTCLADEDPSLQVDWQPQLQQLQVRLLGQVQLEILTQRLRDESHLQVSFGAGRILYAETIKQAVEGVGHFEPLRHYAEVHLLLEPGEPGSGLQFFNQCRVEDMPKNWQHQVMTDLGAKQHLGVLIGAPLTDTKITLLGGRGSTVHTVGGDLRQATWRAVRQGLMELGDQGCQLLEPYYRFTLRLPETYVGRAMNDIQQAGGQFDPPTTEQAGWTKLIGRAPVAVFKDYAATVRTYTHGQGQLDLVPAGNYPCRNAAAVIADTDYEPTADLANTPDSVFCAHGAGYPVKWSAVPEHMHVPYYWQSMQK